MSVSRKLPRVLRGIAVAVLAIVLVACGTERRDTSAAGAAEVPAAGRAHVREDAVRLVIEDWSAVALPGAWDTSVLRERMRRYMAAGSLERRVRETAAVIRATGGRRSWQAWLDTLTVGRWEKSAIAGKKATVTFVSAGMLSYHRRRLDSALLRWTVNMVWEVRRWRLQTVASDWLGPEGPMGQPGSRAIKELPEHVVFKNPRP